MSKSCSYCGSIQHTAFLCRQKPRITLKTRSSLQAHKPINKVGRTQRETAKAVAKWKRTQKPNHQGYYECYICHRRIEYLMAEHVKSKVRNPELRTDPNNLKPTCADCNRAKGSHNN